MMSRTDPDFWRHLQDKKAERDREWLAGKTTDAIYTGRLLAYGYTPSSAATELSLLRMAAQERKTVAAR
jgi:hypothetical protein